MAYLFCPRCFLWDCIGCLSRQTAKFARQLPPSSRPLRELRVPCGKLIFPTSASRHFTRTYRPTFAPINNEMKSATILFTLCLLVCSPVWAQWKFSQGSVKFSLKNAGLRVNGTFQKLSAVVAFDPEHPETAKIEASVDVQSISTGIALRDKHLKKEEFFHVDKFPLIHLRLVKLEKDGAQWKGSFELTLKGTKQTVSIPITFVAIGNRATLSGHFVINRLDYKVGENSWTMGDDVTIDLNAALTL